MITKQHQAQNGKVLAFKKEGDFFYKRGVAMLEKNKMLDAILNFQKAVESDLENEEFAISLAEAFSNIGKYDESNKIIFAHFPNVETRPAECFFGLGCNFASMMDYENAKACLEQYLSMDSDGEYACEACDVLDAIDAFEREQEKEPYRKTELREVKEPIPSIHEVLTAEDDDEKFGIAAIEKMIIKDKKLFFLRNLLAVKHFLKQEFDKAEAQTALVLQEDASNIHAHCNNVMIAFASKNEEVLRRELEYIKNYRTENMNELNRIGLTLLEYSSAGEALPVLKHMYSKAPYEKTIVHKLAICYYALEEYKKSIELYDRLLKMDEKDDVAFYYRGICKNALSTGTKRGALVLDYEVPMDEVVSRIARIKEFVQLSFEEQIDMWQKDVATERLIIWGIRCHDLGVKRAMLALISTFEDKKAELELRKFLLNEHENDELKREVFALLAQMQAKDPYIAYVGGALVESRVDRIDFMEKIPKIYRDVLTNCIERMEQRYSTDALIYATHTWKKFITANTDGLKPINRNQAEALTAVLEYRAANAVGENISKYELCEKYNISSTRFENALAKLNAYTNDGDEL